MHNDFIFLPYSDIYLSSIQRLDLHKKQTLLFIHKSLR